MSKIHMILLGAALAAAPSAVGSIPIYKDYCENPAIDWATHKYYLGTTLNDKIVGTGESGYSQPGDGNILKTSASIR